MREPVYPHLIAQLDNETVWQDGARRIMRNGTE